MGMSGMLRGITVPGCVGAARVNTSAKVRVKRKARKISPAEAASRTSGFGRRAA